MIKKNKILIFSLVFFVLSSSIVLAVTGVKQTDTFYDSSTSSPVTGVQEILYTCSDSSCSSQGNLVHNLNTGGSNSITFEYPYNPSSTQSNPDYYSHFSFKDCYLPKEYKEWVWGYGVSVQYDYHLNKISSCKSPIDSFSVTNKNYVNEPVVINMEVLLGADVHSAFTDLQLNWFPAGYEDHYSAETKVTLKIYDESNNVVYTKQKILNILMDTSENVQFEWTPTQEGNYKAKVTTDVIDCQCQSSVEQYSERQFEVWEGRPYNECYTIINNLKAVPEFGFEDQEATISFTKISNYADNNYDKLPVPTRAVYDITKNGESVYYKSVLLDANSDPVNPKTISFKWTPETGGEYTIKVTGVAESSLCYGKTNPEDIAILGYSVDSKEKYDVTFIVKDSQTKQVLSGADVSLDSQSGATNTAGKVSFSVNSGNYEWTVSKIGYESELGNVQVDEDTTVNVELEELEIACYINEDCGQSGFIGEGYCKWGNVWKDFIEYTCNEPGTFESYCSNEIIDKLFQVCEYGCENGECLPEPSECEIDLDCGLPQYSDYFCEEGNVHRELTIPICSEGNCLTDVIDEFVEWCEFGCNNGECLPEPQECETDTDCGLPQYSDYFCEEGDVHRELTTPICSEGNCLTDVIDEFVEWCEFGCNNGECLPEPSECEIDLDCGEPYFSDNYCQGDSVVRDHIIPKCISGTCSTLTETELVEECDSDEECKNGECIKEEDDDDKKGKSIGFIELFSECESVWECSDWTSCYDGIKTRNCEDINHCETVVDKPTESVGCESEITEPVLERPVNWLWILLGIFIFLILIIVLFRLLSR